MIYIFIFNYLYDQSPIRCINENSKIYLAMESLLMFTKFVKMATTHTTNGQMSSANMSTMRVFQKLRSVVC